LANPAIRRCECHRRARLPIRRRGQSRWWRLQRATAGSQCRTKRPDRI